MKRQRRSIRLPNYDYSQAGGYFVTVCTLDRECLLGEIVNGGVLLNSYGEIVAQTWAWLAQRDDNVRLDRWVVMPNHLHGIVFLKEGGSRTAPTTENAQTKPLGRLIGAFKTVSTKRINNLRATPGEPFWQRNYYERVIREETEIVRIRQYINDNPLTWEMDQENPTVEPRKRGQESWQV